MPEWYPGGLAIDVGGTYVDGAAADVIVTLDGQVLGTHEVTAFPTATVGPRASGAHAVELPDRRRRCLTPGKHDIRLEYVNIQGWGSFNYWQIEASQPPLILLPETAKLPGSWDYAPVKANFNVSEEDRQVIHALQRAVAREFADGNVHYVPLQDLMPHDEPVFTEDLLHPNAIGPRHDRRAPLRLRRRTLDPCARPRHRDGGPGAPAVAASGADPEGADEGRRGPPQADSVGPERGRGR